ncbi:MAG: hypothetical protein KDE14_15655, partial [Rhodobacteraceae bacterium]|nr:hypothetical protein [Paracoccaceae bacterium]
FSIFCGLGYAVAVYVNYPLFRYYPLVDRFSLTDIANRTLGPAMTWYGWIAIAALPAVVLAVVGKLALPSRLIDKLTPLLWLVPFAILAAGWVREKSWLVGAG